MMHWLSPGSALSTVVVASVGPLSGCQPAAWSLDYKTSPAEGGERIHASFQSQGRLSSPDQKRQGRRATDMVVLFS